MTIVTKIDHADHSPDRDGNDVYVVHHASGDITLRVIQDHDCFSPLGPDAGDCLPKLAMIGHGRYESTAEDVLLDSREITCKSCQGTGTALPNMSTTCSTCNGWGEVDIDDVGEYLRETRDAVASLKITVDGRQPAVIYYTADVIEKAGIMDPDEALKTCADEYERWQDGDCWGYVCHGPASYDSCWGFIGREYAESEASAALKCAIHDADVELAEASYWADRDVGTVPA